MLAWTTASFRVRSLVWELINGSGSIRSAEMKLCSFVIEVPRCSNLDRNAHHLRCRLRPVGFSYFVLPRSKNDATNCAVDHHILRGRRYVSKKRPVYGCRAHYGCSGFPPWRGTFLGDPGRQCERRPHLSSKIALQAVEGGLGGDKTRQERSQRACASSTTDHAARNIQCKCGTPGVCHSPLSCGKGLSGQLPPQGVYVGGTFSGAEQLREIARENNAGSSGWSDSGKDALTFFGLNCAD